MRTTKFCGFNIAILITVCFIQVYCGDKNSSSSKIIDHNSVSKFEGFSSAQLGSARALKVYFEHASVGSNIMSGIDSMTSTYPINRSSVSGDPLLSDSGDSVKDWFDNNNGLLDNARGNPGFDEKITNFNISIQTNDIGSHVNAAFFKFCYIDNTFTDAATAFESYKSAMETLESSYPNVTFVYWTMPLMTTGNTDRDSFNSLVRNYCSANNKFLFDIADIECHSTSGTINTDGGYEALVSEYTTDGGHLNSAGSERAAEALWALLVTIAESRK